MSNEIAVRDDEHPQAGLAQWAEDARIAATLAQSLARTSHAGAFKGNLPEIAAAILAGKEVGLPPISALQAFDVIQGQPRLRANAMRALLQRRGHQIQLVESTPTRCIMRGRRKGDQDWQEVVWTIERAGQLGLTTKDQWKKQPQTMLVARATGELCRLVAADALSAVPYAAEEDDRPAVPVKATVTRVTAADILGEDVDEATGELSPDVQVEDPPGEWEA
mgnify:FL=1